MGKIVVDYPESGWISAQTWCPFCEHKDECWGDSSWEEIITPSEKHESTIKDLDEELRRYLNEVLGFRFLPEKERKRSSKRKADPSETQNWI
ncbi:hypothetical protein DRO64_00765 [Candidatus Bathyarchaeota archaeon]|nr:MAG: hypothetical protein DRO64_00765 [Candidatus Bathyarchaeota archaeon]